MTGSADHCLSVDCDHDETICQCDCRDCASLRRDPDQVLAEAVEALREEYNDFGDEGHLFGELAESLAAVLRKSRATQ